jgi:OOP family OmpA-OmpF porin
MSLMAPLALGSVWKMAGPQGQSGSGIINLLRGQQTEIAAATPSGLSHMLGLGGTPVAAPLPTGIYEREERAAAASPPKTIYEHEERYDAPARATTYEPRAPSGGAKWLPWLILGLIALALLSYFVSRARSRTVQPTRVAVGNVVLPGGGRILIPQGTINFNLASYLASGTVAPRTFVFDQLNFESGSAQLTPDSNETVNNLATILKAYPHATIQLAGHTDNTGNPQTNQQLSLDRANAVKTMLVNDGVAETRISTVGYGQDRPMASNDTDDGRARNRRTELTVTSK